ncbi:MAG TPA: hypothetical protein VIA62_09305 [Thermoanaerobaculia bacterium]|jgi:hypothetical protein|nr:hypothetical protein [Thermoanaerobaculia bacterium]
MSSKLCRTILLSVVVLALTAALPAFAGQEPAQAPAGCPPAANLFAAQDQAQLCKANDAVAVPATPEFMTTPVTTNKYTGYCQCGCRFVKDCNTDADCHGGRCLSGVSCC